MAPEKYRLQKHDVGEIRVSNDAHLTPETQRAHKNSSIIGFHFSREFLCPLEMIKFAPASMKVGLPQRQMGETISKAAWKVMESKLEHQFPTGIFQTCSGASTHMNAKTE